MALIYVDSFDHYEAADATRKGWNVGTGGEIITTSVFRHGAQSLSVQPTGDGRRGRSLPSDYATIVLGFGMYQPNPHSNSLFLRLDDAGTTHVFFTVAGTGRIRAYRGDNTLLGEGTISLLTATWYFIEIKVTINDSTGVVVVKVNGVTDINLSSQDTRNGANAFVNQIRFEQGTSGAYYDDLYILDTTGGAPTNDFLGDVRVEALLPNGNGNSSQFDGSDGNQVDNYLLVDETPAIDDDTTYVESADVNDKDTYAFSNLTPTSGTVFGVQQTPCARKTDAGSRNFVNVARLSATETDSATKTLNTTYAFFPTMSEAKPGGGVWTITDVNNAEFGMKIV
jgi:hypothetical protein